ncbi:MAG: hypothetical protein MJ237_05205 [bacterium]|nr:hypothetical protein [bacterium]
MCPTAAALSHLLQLKSDLTIETMRSIEVQALYQSNNARLTAYEKKEAEHTKAYDKFMDTDKKITFNGHTYEKDEERSERVAAAYADFKVKNFDPAVLDELQNIDMNYDLLKELVNTKIEVINADIKNAEGLVQTEAQKTHLLGGGGGG